MASVDLSEIYRGYIACLNKQDWSNPVNSSMKTCITMTPTLDYQVIGKCSKAIFAPFPIFISISLY